jgi:hypothetical protein
MRLTSVSLMRDNGRFSQNIVTESALAGYQGFTVKWRLNRVFDILIGWPSGCEQTYWPEIRSLSVIL